MIKLGATGLLLAGCFLLGGSAAAGNLVPLNDGSGWVDTMTGAFYPNVSAHTAVDPRTGRTMVVPEAGRRSQAQQGNPPSLLDCQWGRNSEHEQYTLRCPR